MTDHLTGRVALLTGASGGIGRALGRLLIAAGVRTAFAYGGQAEQAERLVTEAKDAGVDAIALPGDLADPEVPARLVRRTAEALGPVDVLIPNAGIAIQLGYTDVDLDVWDRTMAINLRAPFLLARETVPGMAERGFGRVLFMSSIAAFTGGIVGPHYASSKAGLHGLVHFLASRVAGQGVTVNALAPALIEDTGMFPTIPAGVRPVPVGRFGRPEEVADLAMAILRNGYLTNQTITLDGGAHPR
ncbi:3-oxoacyl-ACP reductase [Microtetraspora sp. NBRC 13810]|uniref:SDR family NAD(P)-dependent oxidoreductase n=1 Tax=Microtetraspora sp. NBRC 13810 TaxID=3030990 RepID=UPI00249FEDD8|nr:SDR family NAD(P)-dependent oxidoreductase [Microtetraspora sp. NBRC 13810]GLW10833.1 3-oxoacyl-ACP reductase [Microtetraspora sp. NBRC 13810]